MHTLQNYEASPHLIHSHSLNVGARVHTMHPSSTTLPPRSPPTPNTHAPTQGKTARLSTSTNTHARENCQTFNFSPHAHPKKSPSHIWDNSLLLRKINTCYTSCVKLEQIGPYARQQWAWRDAHRQQTTSSRVSRIDRFERHCPSCCGAIQCRSPSSIERNVKRVSGRELENGTAEVFRWRHLQISIGIHGVCNESSLLKSEFSLRSDVASARSGGAKVGPRNSAFERGVGIAVRDEESKIGSFGGCSALPYGARLKKCQVLSGCVLYVGKCEVDGGVVVGGESDGF